MAKQRCPVCGASHKDDAIKCRLCGASMEDPATLPGSVGVRTTAPRKKGLGGVAVLAVVGVVVIGALALFLGLTRNGDVVTKVKDEVPAIAGANPDGWQTVDDADGGFTVEMPGEPDKGFVPFQPADDGRAEQVTAPIGEETQLSVSYTKVNVPGGTGPRAELRDLASAWAEALGGSLSGTTRELTVNGYQALEVTIDGLRLNGEPATAKACLILKGDTLYVVQSLSVYEDHPQYGRLVNSLTFTS